MKNKKGITPVIAVILLLMMTVAAAGAAFFWFVRIQSELQGGTESYQQQLTEKVSAKVDVLTTQYVNGDLNIYLQNRGNVNIPLSVTSSNPTTNWILFDASSNIICSSNWASGGSAYCAGCASDGTLEVGEIQNISLNLANACDDIAGSSYNNGTMFSYMIDFSGVTATGAQFIK